MRSIPGMTVLCPADDIEAKAMVRAAYEHDGPVYLRFSRAASPVFHDESYTFEIGKGEILKDGNDAAVIAAGLPVSEALKAAEKLEEEGIHIRVVNMGSLKPVDEDLILRCAQECGRIITLEEHTVNGGLGDAVSAVTCAHHPVRIHRLGIQDEFGHSGSAAELLREFGLTAETIILSVRDMLLEDAAAQSSGGI